MDAWAAYVNSTGGIDGRKVIIGHKDSALDRNTYTADIKAMATSVFANVGTYSLVDSCGEATLKANPQFVDLEGAVINATIDPLPKVFSPIAMPPGYSTTGSGHAAGIRPVFRAGHPFGARDRHHANLVPQDPSK